jgi:hypothetical protein
MKDRWCIPNLSIIGIESSGKGSVISRKVVGKVRIYYQNLTFPKVNIRYVPDQTSSEIIDLVTTFVKLKFSELKSTNQIEVRTLRTGDWWLGYKI